MLPRAWTVLRKLTERPVVKIIYADTGGNGPQIWGLAIEGESIVEPAQAYRAQRRDGYWFLGFGMLFSLIGTWLCLMAPKRPKKEHLNFRSC